MLSDCQETSGKDTPRAYLSEYIAGDPFISVDTIRTGQSGRLTNDSSIRILKL